MTKNTVSRRGFLKGAGAVVAAPYVITSAALGAAGKPAASARIVMGTIGLGGRGTQDLGSFMENADVQMVAVCDVVGKRRDGGKNAVDKKYDNKDCAAYRDFRELLARSDIDAVLIATGDNWHSMVSILAAKAGKDIYCEKPMSVTIAESRAAADVIKRYGTIFQCGTQRRSVFRFKYAVDLARSGKLGKLQTLYAEKAPPWFPYHENTLPPQSQPPPEVCDWDMWLGPAPWRPYNPGYMARNFWGGHRDFSGGLICEWGSHTADLCQWANDADGTSAAEYELAEGTVVARYANGVKLVFEKGEWPLHVRFVGSEGMIYADDDGKMEAKPESLLERRNYGTGYPAGDHVRNFLDCVKSRRQPVSTIEASHRSITTCHVANICLRLGRKVVWNPEKEQFVDDPLADRLRARPFRLPWRLT